MLVGEHLGQLKKRQDQLCEVLEAQLADIDAEHLLIGTLQTALLHSKARVASQVALYRETYQKFAVVSDQILLLEPDVDDLMTKSEIC